MGIKIGQMVVLPFVIPATELAAGTPTELVAPCDFFIDELQIVVQTAVTTGGAVTVEINGAAVAGLSITVENGATKGTVLSDTPTANSPTRKVEKGDRIEIIPASDFATAGALAGNLIGNTGA